MTTAGQSFQPIQMTREECSVFTRVSMGESRPMSTSRLVQLPPPWIILLRGKLSFTRAKVNEEEEGDNSKVTVDDDIEQLRVGDSDNLELKDVVADLYRENRFASEADFDGESLMEKLMSKWDEDEENESDEFEVGGIKETLAMLNDDEYHRSISEEDFSEVTSSSEEEETESDESSDSVVGNETTEDDKSTTDSDNHEVDDSIEKGDSDEKSSESDSANESLTWSEPTSDDSVDSNDTEDDYSD